MKKDTWRQAFFCLMAFVAFICFFALFTMAVQSIHGDETDWFWSPGYVYDQGR